MSQDANSGPATVMGEHLDLALVGRSTSDGRARRDLVAWLLFGSMLLAIWQVTRLQLYEARTETGYWLGVTGGVLMLLLFAYPLRKRWSLLANRGKAKHWFAVHMVLGILGPITILAHCTFKIGSLNAGVALVSMLIVAISGIAGRFFYMRIHRGLGGERETLDALRRALGFTAEDVHSELSFAPRVEARLRALDQYARSPGDGWGTHFRSLVVLPLELRRQRKKCQVHVARALVSVAKERGWNRDTRKERTQRAQLLVAGYVNGVKRIAQLSAYTRLFSLWHILHVPFVFVMVLCVIAHIIAVHAY